MTFDESFWSGLAFIVLIILLGRSVKGAVCGALDKRSDKIRNDIDEAAALREEAQTLLHTCKRHYLEAKDQAKEIIAHAEEEAERLKKEAVLQLHDLKIAEEHALQERIALAERQAVEDIKQRAIEIALRAAKGVLSQSMTAQKDDEAFEDLLETIKSAKI